MVRGGGSISLWADSEALKSLMSRTHLYQQPDFTRVSKMEARMVRGALLEGLT